MRLLHWLAALLGLAALACSGRGTRSAADAGLAVPGDAKLLPARLRRLTNLELTRNLQNLMLLEVTLEGELPPDVRQEGYTPNARQDVSPAWAAGYAAKVRELAEKAVSEGLGRLAPCQTDDDACSARTVRELGLRAFRRPLTPAEQAAFEGTLKEGAAATGGFRGGVALLLRQLAESPSFIYLSELGAGNAVGRRVRLDNYELASLLAFTVQGGPPDAELLERARDGSLATGHGRAAEARRLLGLSDTRHQFRRFVLEWLEVDGLLQTAKSSRAFPSYELLKPFMLSETEDYVDEVMVSGGASVAALIGGGFASVGPEMARFYGLKTYGPRASLAGTGRAGVLQQASFLAAHAHEDVTSPVKRGDFVMRKLLCERVKRPAEIGLEVVMPPPSDKLSQRERLGQHVADPGCAVCHSTLDAFGFTFEGFDAMGGVQRTDHGKPVQTRASVRLGQSPDAELLELDSSLALTQALAGKPVTAECFLRHAFRYFSAQADPAVEETFLGLRDGLPEASRDNLLEVLVAYVASDLFALREVTPG